MTLKFPTLAEQAIQAYEAAIKTVSLVKIAKDLGGERSPNQWDSIEFWFDDDSSLRITGRGCAHRYEALLP